MTAPAAGQPIRHVCHIVRWGRPSHPTRSRGASKVECRSGYHSFAPPPASTAIQQFVASVSIHPFGAELAERLELRSPGRVPSDPWELYPAC